MLLEHLKNKSLLNDLCEYFNDEMQVELDNLSTSKTGLSTEEFAEKLMKHNMRYNNLAEMKQGLITLAEQKTQGA